MDVIARAWLDGYTVEKEPKYTVKFKLRNNTYAMMIQVHILIQVLELIFTKSDLEKLDLAGCSIAKAWKLRRWKMNKRELIEHINNTLFDNLKDTFYRTYIFDHRKRKR